MNRRRFLFYSAGMMSAFGSGGLFPRLKLWAADNTPVGLAGSDHFLVVLRTDGGLDATLGLDPQILAAGADIQDMFVEYRPDEILQKGQMRLAPAAAPLFPHADDLLIINGIMMRRDAGHDVLNQYMLTGRGDNTAASLPVELGLSMGLGPFGVLTNSSIYLAGKSALISSTQELMNGVDTSLIGEIEQKLIKLDEKGDSALIQSEKKLVEGKAGAIAFNQLIDEFKKQGTINEGHATAAAFLTGISKQAQLDIRASTAIDTHTNHEKVHLGSQMQIWTKVAELFSLFKKQAYGSGSLFDATTFFVISEFSRTPALNLGKGKDHNPFTNSVLLAGKGLKRGKVVGASRLLTRKETEDKKPLHIARPYNFKTNQFAETPETGTFFFPENVIRTLGVVFGNPAGFAPVAPEVLPIPGVALGAD